MKKRIEKFWNENATYYQKISKIPIDVHYGPSSPNEKNLKLLGNVKNKKIIEIGCGGAQCSIAFAKQGAKVTAIDFSEKQLEYAQKLAKTHKVKVKFCQADMEKLKPIKSASQDIAFSAFAIQYAQDQLKVFKEVRRVLKKNGIFVFSLDHPFFSIVDEKGKIKRSYLQTGKRISNNSLKAQFIVIDRTISNIFNALTDAGFLVEKIIEPDSRKKYSYDPWKGLWDYKKRKLNLIPPTIIFKARKWK